MRRVAPPSRYPQPPREVLYRDDDDDEDDSGEEEEAVVEGADESDNAIAASGARCAPPSAGAEPPSALSPDPTPPLRQSGTPSSPSPSPGRVRQHHRRRHHRYHDNDNDDENTDHERRGALYPRSTERQRARGHWRDESPPAGVGQSENEGATVTGSERRRPHRDSAAAPSASPAKSSASSLSDNVFDDMRDARSVAAVLSHSLDAVLHSATPSPTTRAAAASPWRLEPESGHDESAPYASPGTSSESSSLPIVSPAVLVELDAVRDENERLRHRLSQLAVEVEQRRGALGGAVPLHEGMTARREASEARAPEEASSARTVRYDARRRFGDQAAAATDDGHEEGVAERACAYEDIHERLRRWQTLAQQTADSDDERGTGADCEFASLWTEITSPPRPTTTPAAREAPWQQCADEKRGAWPETQRRRPARVPFERRGAFDERARIVDGDNDDDNHHRGGAEVGAVDNEQAAWLRAIRQPAAPRSS